MTARNGRVFAGIAALAGCSIFFAPPAQAGTTLDRIRRVGILHCAAIERPGYAEIEDSKPMGRAADLCRRAAERVLGPGGRFALRLLDLDSDFDRVRDGEVDLVFLEPRTVSEQHLGTALMSVDQAYQDRFVVMLPESAAPRTLAMLKGETICFMIGDPVWPLLAEDLEARNITFRPFGFSEEVEMKDAYNVGRCSAMAGLASTLGSLREDEGVKHLKSRFLDEALGSDTVAAMVPPGDVEWAQTVRDALTKTPQ